MRNSMREVINSILFLCIILMLTAPIPAKERHGADVLIRKIDGTEVRGELIAVKSQALLVLARTGGDVTTPVSEIDYVKVIKKAHPWWGAGIGLLTGIACGMFYGAINPGTAEPAEFYVTAWPVVTGPAGALIGAISSGLFAFDKTYLIYGLHPGSVKTALNQLRKKARVREVE